MNQWLWRLKPCSWRHHEESEATQEMQAYFDIEVDAVQRRGLNADEAKRSAWLKVGSVSEGLQLRREEFAIRWRWAFADHSLR